MISIVYKKAFLQSLLQKKSRGQEASSVTKLKAVHAQLKQVSMLRSGLCLEKHGALKHQIETYV